MASTKDGEKSAAKKIAQLVSSYCKYYVKLMLIFVTMIAVGLVVKMISPVFFIFMTMYYAQLIDGLDHIWIKTYYRTNFKDHFIIFVALVICEIVSLFVRHKVLNKIDNKLNLSKSKKVKFHKSRNLIIFNAVSIIWTLTLIIVEHCLADLSSPLSTGCSYKSMLFSVKLFYIIHFIYWANIISELYFQKEKKKEMFYRLKYSVLNLIFILTAYLSNFYYIGVLVLGLYNISELAKHASTLIEITKKKRRNKKTHRVQYDVYKWLFFVIQSSILVLSQATIWFYDMNNTKYSEELHNFEPFVYKLFFSFGALTTQLWIINEFLSTQNPKGLGISKLLCFFKFKAEAHKYSSNEKLENIVNQKIDIPVKVDLDIKKTLKKKGKKTPKI